MAFIFGGGRSTSPVVEHAQKVVADLQVALQEKDKRIKSLEVGGDAFLLYFFSLY
jgi:hypothetical protein